jgi:carbon-monoxide dehydrogenase large subunit
VSAICDALGVAHIDMPVTPEKMWRVLASRQAEARAA